MAATHVKQHLSYELRNRSTVEKYEKMQTYLQLRCLNENNNLKYKFWKPHATNASFFC